MQQQSLDTWLQRLGRQSAPAPTPRLILMRPGEGLGAARLRVGHTAGPVVAIPTKNHLEDHHANIT